MLHWGIGIFNWRAVFLWFSQKTKCCTKKGWDLQATPFITTPWGGYKKKLGDTKIKSFQQKSTMSFTMLGIQFFNANLYEPIVGMFRDVKVCDYCNLPDDSACWSSSCPKKTILFWSPNFSPNGSGHKVSTLHQQRRAVGSWCFAQIPWPELSDIETLSPWGRSAGGPMCSGHAALHGHNRAARSCEGDGVSAEDGPQGSGQRAVKTWPGGAKGWKTKHTIYVESLGWLDHLYSLKLKCSYLVRFVPLA